MTDFEQIMETTVENDLGIQGQLEIRDYNMETGDYDDIDFESDMDPRVDINESDKNEPSSSSRKVIRHSLAQVSHLKHMYTVGMRSCSKDNFILIKKAAKETNLTTDQVKVLPSV